MTACTRPDCYKQPDPWISCERDDCPNKNATVAAIDPSRITDCGVIMPEKEAVPRICPHGHLARSCELCAAANEIAHLTRELSAASLRYEEVESQRDNLLARIFRDGGQHQATYATSAEACEAADALCVIYIHNADRCEELEKSVEVGHQISGSFFAALKPLKLSHINVADPGQHVTELISRVAQLLSLLTEARATLEMWKDVAPAVSLCKDIDAAIDAARQSLPAQEPTDER